MRDRCLFFSIENAKTAANWTMARQTCHGLHESGTLISIRDKVDQDSLMGKANKGLFIRISLNVSFKIYRYRIDLS